MHTPAPLDPPERLGKYEILQRLAVGGMAEIYLARVSGIQGFQKQVVIKTIRPQYAGDQKFIDMFLDEARLAALLHHQNIAQVYDIGRDGHTYFFSMEYLHGHDVRTLLKHASERNQKIPLEHTLAIVAGVAAGLHYAHEKRGADSQPLQIVHRDVSPANIFVTYDGGVKLVDFGIARAAQRSAETRTGSLKGKISYMSPEQCVGEELDRRSDIFSLGIVLYELSTVSRLFRSSQASDYLIMDRIVKGHFPPPTAIRRDYPADLESIVMRALSIHRSARYSTAQELLLDLEKYAAEARLPLSPTALSAYVIQQLGRRPDTWHDGDAAPGAGSDAEISTTVERAARTAITINVDGGAPLPRIDNVTRSELLLHVGATEPEATEIDEPPSEATAPTDDERPEAAPRRGRRRAVAALGAVAALALAVLGWRAFSGNAQEHSQPDRAEQPNRAAEPRDVAPAGRGTPSAAARPVRGTGAPESPSNNAELGVDAAPAASDEVASSSTEPERADSGDKTGKRRTGKRRTRPGKRKNGDPDADKTGVADELIDKTW